MGIGLAGIVEHLIGQSGLDDPAALHHHHAMRQQPRDREVMGDDNGGKPEFADEVAHEIEQPRLHRHVEPAGRLVHEHQPRCSDQIARDLQPLPHAARIGLWRIVDAADVDLDALQPRGRGIADTAVVIPADRHQPLADIGAGGDRHPQPLRGVLVHIAPIGAEQETPLGLAKAGQIAQHAVAHPVRYPPRARLHLRREQLQQRGLARAGFADDRQHLARIEREGHVTAGGEPAVILPEAFSDQQRPVVVSHSRSDQTCAFSLCGAALSLPRWPAAWRPSQ